MNTKPEITNLTALLSVWQDIDRFDISPRMEDILDAFLEHLIENGVSRQDAYAKVACVQQMVKTIERSSGLGFLQCMRFYTAAPWGDGIKAFIIFAFQIYVAKARKRKEFVDEYGALELWEIFINFMISII